MRLIDADALINALKSNCKPELCHDYGNAWCEACCPYNNFEDLIDNAPTVEEKSYAMGYQDGSEDGLQDIRPQGEWIWRETGTSNFRYGYFTCSNCSFVSKAKQNFCAECGADMRKEGAE